MDKLKWTKLDPEGEQYRSAVGTIRKRATGWFFYRRGERKAHGGVFASLAKAKAHAATA
jgi:hypothetical protein